MNTTYKKIIVYLFIITCILIIDIYATQHENQNGAVYEIHYIPADTIKTDSLNLKIEEAWSETISDSLNEKQGRRISFGVFLN